MWCGVVELVHIIQHALIFILVSALNFCRNFLTVHSCRIWELQNFWLMQGKGHYNEKCFSCSLELKWEKSKLLWTCTLLLRSGKFIYKSITPDAIVCYIHTCQIFAQNFSTYFCVDFANTVNPFYLASIIFSVFTAQVY